MCTRESILNDVLAALQQVSNYTIDPALPNVESLRLDADLGLSAPARKNLAATFHKFSRRCGGPAIGPSDTEKLKTIGGCVNLIAKNAKCLSM